MLNFVVPDFVSIFHNGRIVETGGPELAHVLEEKGYAWVEAQYGSEEVTAAALAGIQN
jgi:Fe-S cluster assembly ATP-binding protein